MKKTMTRSEAIKIFKKYGILHDILSDPLHDPKYGENLKQIIKESNRKETK